MGGWRSPPGDGVEEAKRETSGGRDAHSTERGALWVSSRTYSMGLISNCKRCLSST